MPKAKTVVKGVRIPKVENLKSLKPGRYTIMIDDVVHYISESLGVTGRIGNKRLRFWIRVG